MEATIDRTAERPRYLRAPTRPPGDIENLLTEMRWVLNDALAGPGCRQHRKARKHAREFAQGLVALLEWTLEQEPSSEASGDLQAYFDALLASPRENANG